MRSNGVGVGERLVVGGGSVLVEVGWVVCDGGPVRLIVSLCLFVVEARDWRV